MPTEGLADGASNLGAGDGCERGTGGGWVFREKSERESLSVKVTLGVRE